MCVGWVRGYHGEVCTPKNNPISPSVATTMGLLVLLLFKTSVDGIVRPSNREKNTIFASQSGEKRIGDGFKIK